MHLWGERSDVPHPEKCIELQLASYVDFMYKVGHMKNSGAQTHVLPIDMTVHVCLQYLAD